MSSKRQSSGLAKTMIKQFIKGVNPARFCEELELLEIESFSALEDRFNIYYEHHERLEKLVSAGCLGTGPSHKEPAVSKAETRGGTRGKNILR